MSRVVFRYYGISPWEIEVLYGYFTSRFDVVQEEIEPDESRFVSKIGLSIPVAFSEEFFRWFNYRRWEKVKALFKEMKRRRGSGNAIKVNIEFLGEPTISFSIDSQEKPWFDNSIEKLDFVLELLPYHFEKLPPNCTRILYGFDPGTVRWKMSQVHAGDRGFVLRGEKWQPL